MSKEIVVRESFTGSIFSAFSGFLGNSSKSCLTFYMDENHRLGGGAFGQVFLGYSTKLQKTLAVKQVIIPHN